VKVRRAVRAVRRTKLPLFSAALLWAAGAGCGPRAGPLATEQPRAVYPPPPARPRIVYLTSLDDASSVAPPGRTWAEWLLGGHSERSRPFVKPFGLASHGQTLLVCDTQRRTVYVLDFARHRVEQLRSAQTEPLVTPVDVAVDGKGVRYVADAGAGRILVFSPDNRPLRMLAPAEGTPFVPVSLALHDGRLIVANRALHRLEVLDTATGRLCGTFGKKGRGRQQMQFPAGVAVGRDGQIYVTDLLNCRVHILSPDMTWRAAFGQRGAYASRFVRPKHVAVGPDGVVYVVDAATQRVQMFDSRGRPLMVFGGPDAEAGNLTLPAGICTSRALLPHFARWIPAGFAAEYLVFVSNQFGAPKIAVYAYGRPRPGSVAGRLGANRSQSAPPRPSSAEKTLEAALWHRGIMLS